VDSAINPVPPRSVALGAAGIALALLGATVGCGFDSFVLAPGAGDRGAAAGVAAGWEFTCALDAGRGWCFGANVDGALGSGNEATQIAPAAVSTSVGFDLITAGQNHACGIAHGTGALWCWGYNGFGQLGLGDLDARDTPAPLPQPASALAVAAGYNHVCAIPADHSLWCWGDNTEGQLGQDDAEGAPGAELPARVGTASDWLGVAGGQGHSCGVRAPGTMWCWGRNTAGDTGTNPGLEQVRGPAQVGTFTDWTAMLDVGQDSSCGIRADGSLWCWGSNASGQLGVPPESSPVAAPRQVGTDTDWAQISVEAFSACGVKTDGSLWCWGRNAEGQLGVGDINDRYAPTEVMPGASFRAASVGRFHACATESDGTVVCMGENSNGQLGLGDTTRRNIPTAVDLF
jgi:alpha-tubulin suppressor-like RCC1 family protein